jgi:WXG100 family type VII secretion target
MPNDLNIGYIYGSIDTGTDAMMRVNKNVENLVEGLAQEIGTALDSWTGDAATGYAALAERIKTNIGDMNEIVLRLAVELKNGAEKMQSQDRISGNSF